MADSGVSCSAAATTDESRHEACAQLLRGHRGELVVARPVVAETAWFIESRVGPSAEADFVRLITTTYARSNAAPPVPHVADHRNVARGVQEVLITQCDPQRHR